MWFPKPPVRTKLEIVSAGGVLDQDGLFALLTDPDAIEWRDKVGVVGPLDGSGKTTTRLLASGGWVLKTSTALASPEKSELAYRTREAARIGGRARLWHPDKIWGIYWYEDKWYPLNATPELSTLRQLADVDDRLRAWTAMMEYAVEVGLKYGHGLDLNPSNFGTLPDDDRLYYLDDEWYPELKFAELSSAIVARIPEEPEIDAERWESWGRVLAGVFEPHCQSRDDWTELLDNLSAHPIAEQFEAKRSALSDGLRHLLDKRRSSGRKPKADAVRQPSQRTAIIADVHGNSVALDAVLRECKESGVDSYIFVGDAVGYGPDPKGCVQRLAELPNAQYVRGNHDHAIGSGVLRDGMNSLARSCTNWTYEQLSDQERQWLVSLPVDAQGSNWLAVHGAPRDPRRFLAYVYELTYEENLVHLSEQNIRLCFCGHTHVQFIHARTAGGECQKLGAPKQLTLDDSQIFLVNPGSIGQPRDKDTRAAYALWDRTKNSISLHRVSYQVSAVVEKIRKLGLPGRLGDRLLQGI